MRQRSHWLLVLFALACLPLGVTPVAAGEAPAPADDAAALLKKLHTACRVPAVLPYQGLSASIRSQEIIDWSPLEDRLILKRVEFGLRFAPPRDIVIRFDELPGAGGRIPRGSLYDGQRALEFIVRQGFDDLSRVAEALDPVQLEQGFAARLFNLDDERVILLERTGPIPAAQRPVPWENQGGDGEAGNGGDGPEEDPGARRRQQEGPRFGEAPGPWRGASNEGPPGPAATILPAKTVSIRLDLKGKPAEIRRTLASGEEEILALTLQVSGDAWPVKELDYRRLDADERLLVHQITTLAWTVTKKLPVPSKLTVKQLDEKDKPVKLLERPNPVTVDFEKFAVTPRQ